MQEHNQKTYLFLDFSRLVIAHQLFDKINSNKLFFFIFVEEKKIISEWAFWKKFKIENNKCNIEKPKLSLKKNRTREPRI